MIQQRESQPHLYGPDSELAALVDWASAGIMYDGFRLSEWAQPNGHSALDNLHPNIRGDPCAYCIDDITSLSNDKIEILLEQVLQLPSSSPIVGRDFARYRTQKNNMNGQKRNHVRNSSPTAPCHITSAMNLVLSGSPGSWE
jgi:hypothetical protein